MNDIVRYIANFVLFTLIQVLILNNIGVGWYLNPFIYIVFIMILPLDTPGWVLLLAGFFSGLTIDFFSSTPGLHAAASTFLAFLRPLLLGVLIPRDDYSAGTQPSVNFFGWGWFFRYTLLLVVIHHTTLFLLESLSFSHLPSTLLKILTSSIFTIGLILLSQLYRPGNQKLR